MSEDLWNKIVNSGVLKSRLSRAWSKDGRINAVPVLDSLKLDQAAVMVLQLTKLVLSEKPQWIGAAGFTGHTIENNTCGACAPEVAKRDTRSWIEYFSAGYREFGPQVEARAASLLSDACYMLYGEEGIIRTQNMDKGIKRIIRAIDKASKNEW